MESEVGSLQVDPLFVGLTRPTMFLGVSYMFVVVNMFISMLYFINQSDFKVVIIAAVVHMIGYVISFREPTFIELFFLKLQRCRRCPNSFYHGANSYDVY
jgi:type IV secretion system protein VirB3